MPTPEEIKIQDCWKCGYKFIEGHLDKCPAKNTMCNICKNDMSECAKKCSSEMPQHRTERTTQPPLKTTKKKNIVQRNKNHHTIM